jgi:hypothetical protein
MIVGVFFNAAIKLPSLENRRDSHVSNRFLPNSGITYCGLVQRRYCTDRSIATRNQTCSRDIRRRFIESLGTSAGREVDQRPVGSGEEGVGQGNDQMGRLPETIEQTEA